MPDLAFGGQALIEGVMMRGPARMATAVRSPEGKIIVESRDYISLVDRKPALKKPVLRGAIAFFEMMIIGIKALQHSAEVASGNHDAEKSWLSPWALALTMAVGLGFGVLLFVYVPLQSSQWIGLAPSAFYKYENKVYTLPKHLDEMVARLHLAKVGAELDVLRPDQAEYIGVPVEGPYKPDYYRY